MDRIDLQVETPPIPARELAQLPAGEPSAAVAVRVAAARARQEERFAAMGLDERLNARVEGRTLEEAAALDTEARDLLGRAAETLELSARGMVRVLRLARTIADLEGEAAVRRPHVAEAANFRRAPLRA